MPAKGKRADGSNEQELGAIRPQPVPAWIAVALLAVLAAAPYVNSLHGTFHFDDTPQLVEDTSWRTPSGLLAHRPLARQLTFLTFFVNYHLHGLDFLPGWHAMNILLHAGCVLATYGALRAVWRGVGRRDSLAPLLAAAIFAVHPLATEPVNYIQARSVLLYSGLSWLALWGAAIVHQARNARGKAGGGALMAGAIVLAALSKEVGVFYAALLPGLYALCVVSTRVADRRRFWTTAAAVGGFLLVAGTLWAALSGAGRDLLKRFDANFWYHFWGQCTVFWRYVSLAALPLPGRLTVDHYVPAYEIRRYALHDGAVVLALAGLAAMMLVAVALFRRRRPDVAMLVILLPLGLAPYFVAASQEMMVEYRFYLSLGAFCGLAGAAFDWAARRWKQALPLAAALCALLALGTVLRNPVWRTDRTLWEDACAKAPRKARTVNALAWVLATDADRPDPKRALELALRSFDARYVDLWPGKNPHMRDTLAEAYFANGQYDKAVAIEDEIIHWGIHEARINVEYFQRQRERYLAARRAAPASRPASSAPTRGPAPP